MTWESLITIYVGWNDWESLSPIYVGWNDMGVTDHYICRVE